MVIKEANGNVRILMSKKDILDYVFEKCGLEVGFEVEKISQQADEAFNQDECCGCGALDDMQSYAESQENMVAELKDKLENQKNLMIDYLVSKKQLKAAQLLKQFDENI